MRKFSIFMVLIYLLINSVAVCATSIEDPTVDTEPQETVEAYFDTGASRGIDASGALLGTEKLVSNVRAAVLYEANSQTMLYSWNADTQMYPASFVKILTALIAIEEGDLTDQVTVKQSSVDSIPFDAVSAKLVADEVINLKDLLYCLIVGSANDAASVIADHIAGSQQAFVDKMNQYAQKIGCTGTNFVNVHGLHNENQHTTARDSARILDAALKNETFNKIFTTYSYEVSATNKSAARSLASSNSMMDNKSRLYYDGRVKGGRTGITQDGRRIIATVSEKNGMKTIAVVMGSETVYQEDGYSAITVGGYGETSKLLDYCYNAYKAVNILYPNQVLRQISLSSGNNDLAIGPTESLMAVLPHNGNVENLVFRYSDKVFSAPVEKGQYVSDVQVWIDNVCVAQTELFALNGVQTASAKSPGSQETETDQGGTVLTAIIVLAIVLIVVFVHKSKDHIVRFIARRLHLAKKRRRRP